MKRIDLFCASPASTAICVSMDHKSMVRHGGRAIDRQNPRLIDRRRTKQPNPCSQSPSKPKSYHQKSRKSSAEQTEPTSPPRSSGYLLSDSVFFDVLPSDFDPVPISTLVPMEPTRSRSIKKDESAILKSSSSTRSHDQVLKVYSHQKSRKSSAKQVELTSPPQSSRYLLSDSAFFDVLPSDFDPVPVSSLVPKEPTRSRSIEEDESAILKSSSTRSHEQVVVLRVSLHCKGCEGKVRKHISRMQGVTSFNIDFQAKKVTVIGNVTPLGVLTSISKVKNAQFWPSPTPSSLSSSSIS